MSCSCGSTDCYDSPELAILQEAYDIACRKLCINPKPFNTDDNKLLRNALAIAVLKAAKLGVRDALTLATFAVATGFEPTRHKVKLGAALVA